jgi:hypothetical protein
MQERQQFPFWDSHKASELLEYDEESGKAKELLRRSGY